MARFHRGQKSIFWPTVQKICQICSNINILTCVNILTYVNIFWYEYIDMFQYVDKCKYIESWHIEYWQSTYCKIDILSTDSPPIVKIIKNSIKTIEMAVFEFWFQRVVFSLRTFLPIFMIIGLS